MSEASNSRVPLLIAALITGIQSLALLALSAEVFFDISSENLRVSSGVGLLLGLLGLGLGAAAVGLVRGAHLARGPVVVTQLISLGLAWNLVKSDKDLPGIVPAGIVLAVAAVIVMSCLATKSARAALADRPSDL